MNEKEKMSRADEEESRRNRIERISTHLCHLGYLYTLSLCQITLILSSPHIPQMSFLILCISYVQNLYLLLLLPNTIYKPLAHLPTESILEAENAETVVAFQMVETRDADSSAWPSLLSQLFI